MKKISLFNFKKIYHALKGAPFPQTPMAILWGIWFVGAYILIDVILYDVPVYFTKVTVEYFIGMLPVVMIFNDKEYVKKKLSGESISIVKYLYLLNIIIIALFISDYANKNSGVFLLTESVMLFYWVLSIPLAFIYNKLIWCLSAGFVFINTLLYKSLLQNCLFVWNKGELLYLALTVGIVALAAIGSFLISKCLIIYEFGKDAHKPSLPDKQLPYESADIPRHRVRRHSVNRKKPVNKLALALTIFVLVIIIIGPILLGREITWGTTLLDLNIIGIAVYSLIKRRLCLDRYLFLLLFFKVLDIAFVVSVLYEKFS